MNARPPAAGLPGGTPHPNKQTPPTPTDFPAGNASISADRTVRRPHKGPQGNDMNTLTIAQPASNTPAGLPYGVTANSLMGGGKSTTWFATETAAWEQRDLLLEQGFTGVRVIGADAHLAAC